MSPTFNPKTRHFSFAEDKTEDLAAKKNGSAASALKLYATPQDDDADLEDILGKENSSRPTEIAYASKRKGFHLYARKGVPYRDAKERTLDYEEIYAEPKNRSKRWFQLMETQSARCMDCGTPTCHYPNQKGGGCPLANRIPTWNTLVHENQWKAALERLLDTNNFPEFTGTTCPAPCEQSCVLGINEEPVAIKSIELAIIEYGFDKGWVKPQMPKFRSTKKVVIVGSGPCGLAAAQQLNRAGHEVLVLEKEDQVGGLLTYGIPNMKLAKTKVKRRVDLLKQEGIQFECNTALGRDCTLESLRQRFDAVLLATGSTVPRQLPKSMKEAHTLKNIIQAMDFLVMAQKMLKGQEIPSCPEVSGKHCVVIGGGDTSVDAIATLLRMGAASVAQFSRRQKSPDERTPCTQWPAWGDFYRVDYAHEEYASVSGRDPREYVVQAAEFRPAENDPTRVGSILAIQDNQKRVFPAELVVLAMGFMGPEHEGTETILRDHNGNFLSPEQSYACLSTADHGRGVDRVFCAGDCRRGATLIVTAIAEGRDVAQNIDEYLMTRSSLPRCKPLSRNPALLRLDWESEYRNARFTRRKLKPVMRKKEMASSFERGFLFEDEEEYENERIPSSIGAAPSPTRTEHLEPPPTSLTRKLSGRLKLVDNALEGEMEGEDRGGLPPDTTTNGIHQRGTNGTNGVSRPGVRVSATTAATTSFMHTKQLNEEKSVISMHNELLEVERRLEEARRDKTENRMQATVTALLAINVVLLGFVVYQSRR